MLNIIDADRKNSDDMNNIDDDSSMYTENGSLLKTCSLRLIGGVYGALQMTLLNSIDDKSKRYIQ